jgi:hypothetical protein
MIYGVVRMWKMNAAGAAWSGALSLWDLEASSWYL